MDRTDCEKGPNSFLTDLPLWFGTYVCLNCWNRDLFGQRTYCWGKKIPEWCPEAETTVHEVIIVQID